MTRSIQLRMLIFNDVVDSRAYHQGARNLLAPSFFCAHHTRVVSRQVTRLSQQLFERRIYG